MKGGVIIKIRNKFPEVNKGKNNLLLKNGWYLIKEPKHITQSIILFCI